MYGEQLLDTAAKTRLDTLKTASKNVFHRAAEATGGFIGNRIADKIVKPDEKSRNVEEIIIPPEKRDKILKESRQVL